MAFHVACPITCERICYCGLGSLGGRVRPWEDIARVERFLEDPWWVREGEGGVARVLVPRVVPVGESLGGGGEDADVEVEEGGGGVVVGAASAQAKRAALQRRAAAASLAAEDYVRKLEMGAVADELGEAATDQVSSAVKVICRICFSGENEGSERARKMLSCKICNKKYHKSCLKSWAEYRDLFHWSSWACPSCRVCEICRRAGDPNKFMFCKRCDAAYHCYCQQPSHKNVSHGPYLCPKHTRCHSCGSTVHGSGHSTRWFLGYNFCDACGRLFMKEKYCPVCLKVYRDSESTPMVCCDVCQRWVHCQCDGISDEKYLQFQADRNLYYKCAACRGDCYQVTDVDDAVQELWRRRDKADRDMIAKLRAAAGLPSEEEYFAISPYSDDDDGGPVILKSDYGRSLKFSVKGLSDNAAKNITEEEKKVLKSSSTNKKSVKKKGYQVHLSGEPFENLERSEEARSLESSFVDEKVHHKTVGSGTKIKFSVDHLGSVHHSQNHETVANNVNEVNIIHTKETFHGSYFKEGIKQNEPKNESVKGTKLVIHLGGRNRKLNSSPMSDASSCQRDQEKASSNGSEESSQHKVDDKRHVFEPHAGNIRIDAGRGAELDDAGQFTVSKRLGDVMRLTSDVRPNSSTSNNLEDHQPSSTSKTLIFHRRKTEGRVVGESPGEVDLATRRNDEIPQKIQSKDMLTVSQRENSDVAQGPSFSNSLSKDSRPLLKLKFKNPYLDSHGSSAPKEVERNVVKGQRSKRKRPSLMEKDDIKMGENHVNLPQEANMDEAMDANWILRRLGKNAIGKRVEVHQPSDNSWHKGVVLDALEGSASLSVKLDDGRSKTLELGKQGVRFIPQKQRRTKL